MEEQLPHTFMHWDIFSFCSCKEKNEKLAARRSKVVKKWIKNAKNKDTKKKSHISLIHFLEFYFKAYVLAFCQKYISM